MKRHIWILALLLSAAPAFAQDPEEALRELGMGGVFATGDLALRDIDTSTDPVQQLRRFFLEAKLPLNNDQMRRLEAIIEAQRKAMHSTNPGTEAALKMNQEFMRRVNSVLTPEQITAWKRFRTEQIMLRGGFPALQLSLEEAGTALSAEQEKQARAIYDEFNKEVAGLMRDSKGDPDRATLDKLENTALGKVVKLLTPEQRRALAARRRRG
jgi:hypothetical protein